MRKILILTLLFAQGILFAQNGNDIYAAARAGDIKTAKLLQKENPEIINETNAQGYSPLILASYYNQIDFVAYLIKQKVKINDVEKSSTALQAACYKGFFEIAELLLDYKVNPNIEDANGTTPLLYAVQFNHVDIVELLIKNGVDVNYKDPNGLKAIDYAKKLELTKIVALLKSIE